ncbi:trigger factor [bacterium]|nr:trigger factor [bacterium]
MSEFQKMSDSRVSFSFKIEEKDIDEAKKKVMQRYRSRVSLSGFRKGKAPDHAVVGAVGLEQISFDALNEAVGEKYHDFVTTNALSPIAAPKTDFPAPGKMPMVVKVEVEIFPAIVLGDYKKLKMELPKVEIKESEVDDVIETILSDMQLGKKVDRAVKMKDLVEIDFAGKDEKGNVLPRTEAKNHRVRIGFGHFLPDLEKGMVGMKIGAEKILKVKFPKNYHAPEMAGKNVNFDVKLHTVEEISAKNLEENMLEKITGAKKTIEEFRKDVKNLITKNKTDSMKKEKVTEFYGKFVKLVKGDLPKSWIAREVDGRLEQLKASPQFQHDPEAFWKNVGKTEPAMRKEFESTSERDLRTMLGMTELVKKENVELDRDEQKQALELAQSRLGEDSKPEELDRMLEQVTYDLKIDKYLTGIMI